MKHVDKAIVPSYQQIGTNNTVVIKRYPTKNKRRRTDNSSAHNQGLTEAKYRQNIYTKSYQIHIQYQHDYSVTHIHINTNHLFKCQRIHTPLTHRSL